MSRSLARIFSLQDKAIGTTTKTGGNEKLIKSPINPNNRRVVPGYIDDYVWAKEKRIVEPDINVLTGPNANFARHRIRIIKKVDVTSPAVPERDPIRQQIKEV